MSGGGDFDTHLMPDLSGGITVDPEGGGNPSGVTWANDLASSTDTHQFVSAISGANGTGNTCTLSVGVTIESNASGASAGYTPFRFWPLAATGQTSFGLQIGTESNLGAQNPTWEMGYNVEANPGFERFVWAIEQHFKFGPGVFDTESHWEFFDSANVLLCRSLSTTLYTSLSNRIDTLCSFRNGDSGVDPGAWVVQEASTLTECMRVDTTAISLERNLVRWKQPFSPLLTQDDNASTTTVKPLRIMGQRSSVAAGAGSIIELDIQAPQGVGTDGFIDYRHETAANSGIFASFFTVALDPLSGTAAVLKATAGGLIARNSANTSVLFLNAASTDFVKIGSGNLSTNANGSHIVNLGAVAGTQFLKSSTGHELAEIGIYTGSFVGIWLGLDTTSVGVVPHLWSDSSTLTAINAPPGGHVYGQVAGNSITDTNSAGILPVVDNTYTCGSNAKRWSLVRGVTITSGDLDLCDEAIGAHWTLREEVDCILAVNRETDEWYELPLVKLSAERRAKYEKLRPLSTATKDSNNLKVTEFKPVTPDKDLSLARANPKEDNEKSN